MPPTRIAYLAIPHFPVAVERRGRPQLASQPLLIASARHGVGSSQVLDCSIETLPAGVRPGMPLGQAERLCPEATILSPHLDLYRSTAAELLELLKEDMPAVEPAQPGGAYLDLTGLKDGEGELALCQQLGRATVQKLGLASTAGVAINKFTAEAASLCIGLNRSLALTAGTERSFLSDFSVGLLPVEGETHRRLRLFGLRRLGQFARLPPAAVLAQFGWEGRHAHRLARGEDDRPVVTSRGERTETAAQEFDPPLDNQQTLIAVAGQLAADLSSRLVPAFLRAARVDLSVICADGTPLAASRTLAEPTADAGRLARLAEALLRAQRYPDRVSDLSMTLSELSTPSLHQLSLWYTPQEAEADAHLARLAARYGRSCFRRGVLVDPDHRLAGRRFILQALDPEEMTA